MLSVSLASGRPALAATVFLALITTSRDGLTEPAHGEGATQFALEGQVLSYSSGKAQVGDHDVTSTQTSLSLLSGGGIRLAAFLGDEALLGGDIALSSTSTDNGSGTSRSTTAFSIAPLFEYVLSSGE